MFCHGFSTYSVVDYHYGSAGASEVVTSRDCSRALDGACNVRCFSVHLSTRVIEMGQSSKKKRSDNIREIQEQQGNAHCLEPSISSDKRFFTPAGGNGTQDDA